MLPVVALAGFLAMAPDQEPPLLDRVEVSRVVIDARIVDGRGRAIPSLNREQLRVEVDGTPVRLASVDWIDEKSPGRSLEAPAAPQAFASSLALRAPEPSGRLLVFLFQKDFQGSRMKGLLRMKTWAAALADALSPGDRAAVLTFDSHLRLHADFTNDRARLRDAITRSVVHEWPKPIEPGPFPSLAAHLDARAALDAASPETALLVLGRALAPLPGAKSILLFGWGLGRLTGGMVQMESDYGPAQRALAEARATVFALDITDADYHTLEVGLEQVARDTGGFYAKTHDSPAVAMARLTEALAGYYVLTFDKPAGRRGTHQVNVRLVGRKGTVLARSGYVD
jgi:VWFA-related protein